MTNLLKGHTAITVGNHDFIKLQINEFLELNPIPTNRDSARRVKKMRSIFDGAYLNNQVDTLTEVAIGIVVNDFIDIESGTIYTKGEWYLIDGNTRQHYWKIYPDRITALTNGLTGKIHYLKSSADVEFAYYPYNNVKSSENSTELLQGLARRYNWTPRQPALVTGGYKTAIDWACEKKLGNKANIFEAFNYCFEELKILDSLPKDSTYTITKPKTTGLKSQAIMAAVLVALKNHGPNLRLFDFIERISTITLDELHSAISRGEVDPVQIIAAEYTGLSRNRGANLERWLGQHAGSTKRASQEPQMDFLLHWIRTYIASPKITYNFNRGIRQSSWDGAWDDYFPKDIEEE